MLIRSPRLRLSSALFFLSFLFFGVKVFAEDISDETSTPPSKHLKREYQPLADWRNDVIYTLFTDRFFDGDPANNSKNEPTEATDYQNGDFEGIIQKLDYLKTLGVTTILLNPVFEGRAYHGYHPQKYFKVEKRYGTLEDYKRLIEQAHARKMKVLFDLVLNHVDKSSGLFQRHREQFRESPEVFRAPNETTFPAFKAKISFSDLPDFDHTRPDVQKFLLKVGKFWIDLGIDGFRMDAVTQIEPEFWAWYNAELKKYAGENFFILGEIFEINYFALNYYVKYFDAMFDFRRMFIFQDVFLSGLQSLFLTDIFAQHAAYANPKLLLGTKLDNHDVSRFISRLEQQGFPSNEERTWDRFRQAYALLLLSSGIPTLLYGSEIGLTDEPKLAHTQWDAARRKMSWNENEAQPLFQYFKKLLGIRAEYALGVARRVEIAVTGPLYAYAMVDGKKDARPLVIVYNLFSEPFEKQLLSLRVSPELAGRVKSMTDLLTGEVIPVTQDVISLDMKTFQVRVLRAN